LRFIGREAKSNKIYGRVRWTFDFHVYHIIEGEA
jgi:hypothetical protein